MRGIMVLFIVAFVALVGSAFLFVSSEQTEQKKQTDLIASLIQKQDLLEKKLEENSTWSMKEAPKPQKVEITVQPVQFEPIKVDPLRVKFVRTKEQTLPLLKRAGITKKVTQ